MTGEVHSNLIYDENVCALYNVIICIARNFLETRLKKTEFFKIANSQKKFAKISQIGPWLVGLIDVKDIGLAQPI